MPPHRAKIAKAERTPAGVIMVMTKKSSMLALSPGVEEQALSPVTRWMWTTVETTNLTHGEAKVAVGRAGDTQHRPAVVSCYSRPDSKPDKGNR